MPVPAPREAAAQPYVEVERLSKVFNPGPSQVEAVRDVSFSVGSGEFVSILGHYSWTFDDPLFRLLLLRGIAWSAGEDADRRRQDRAQIRKRRARCLITSAAKQRRPYLCVTGFCRRGGEP